MTELSASKESLAFRVITLHGFLGTPDDFKETEIRTRNALLRLQSSQSIHRNIAIDLEWINVDLVKIWTELPSQDRSLKSSAVKLIGQIGKLEPVPTLVIGYSMGARIAMAVIESLGSHSPLYREMPLRHWVLISGHPGLTDQAGCDERRSYDKTWADRIGSVSANWDEIWEQWNAQPVLRSGSRKATLATKSDDLLSGQAALRKETAKKLRTVWARILVDWGLAEQPNFRSSLASLLRTRTLTLDLIAGEEDAKFTRILRQWHQDLIEIGAEVRLSVIAEVGHRVVHEAADDVATRVSQRIWDVFGSDLQNQKKRKKGIST